MPATIVSMTEAKRLGETLRTVRELAGKSLKAVAEPADISPAYLQKLEKGLVTTPSPHVLHRLADQLGVEYLDLMRLAGYVVPETSGVGVISQALSSQGLTEEEERAVAAYLQIFRSQRGNG
jgi:transcriptional regulator with XRE-family HTH domain